MKTRTIISLTLLCALVAAASLPAAAGTPTRADDVAGSLQTLFYNINDNGDIVGAYVDGQGRHGFLRTNGNDLPIDFQGAAWTEAWDLTNRDNDGKITIVGQYLSQQQIHGFTVQYDPSGTPDYFTDYKSLDVGVRAHTMPQGINDAKLIVGCMHSGGEADMSPWLLLGGSFLLSSKQLTMYTGINQNGDVTGFWSDPAAWGGVGGGQSFVLKGQEVYGFSAFNNANHTRSYGINDAGDTVGFYWGRPGNPGMHGFVRHADGSTEAIDMQGAYMTRAYGINNRINTGGAILNGVIVGAYQEYPGGPWHPFRLDP